jgi:hypothetical protein
MMKADESLQADIHLAKISSHEFTPVLVKVVQTFGTLKPVLFVLRKVGSGTHSDPKFDKKRGGVSYIDTRGRGGSSKTPFRLESFSESRRVPPQKTPS